MRTRKFGVVALSAATGIAAGVMLAPVASADDSCDPAVVVCQGGATAGPTDSSEDFSPSVSAGDDAYPYDGDWFFNPAGGGTALNPVHSGGGSSGGGGGGGHH